MPQGWTTIPNNISASTTFYESPISLADAMLNGISGGEPQSATPRDMIRAEAQDNTRRAQQIMTQLQTMQVNGHLLSFQQHEILQQEYNGLMSNASRLNRAYEQQQEAYGSGAPAPIPSSVFDSFDLDEDEDSIMPTRKSRAKPADEHSWVVSYIPSTDRYAITPPSRLDEANRGWASEVNHRSLEDAYTNAIDYVKRMTRQSSQAGYSSEWKVWPRKGSIPYNNLVNKIVVDIDVEIAPRPKIHFDFKGFYRLVKQGMEHKDKQEGAYKLFDACILMQNNSGDYGFGLSVNKAQEYLKNYIKAKTGIEYVTAILRTNTSRQYLTHPDIVIKAWRSLDKKGGYHYYGKDVIEGNCVKCDCCKEPFTTSLATLRDNRLRGGFCIVCLEDKGFYNCTAGCHVWHHDDDGCPIYLGAPNETIYNYSKDVRSLIHKMPTVATDKKVNGEYLRYGVELEVFPKNDVSKKIAAYNCGKALRNGAILKADASLRKENGTEGFEIVTVPATLEYHRQVLWDNFFKTPYTDGLTAAKSVKSWNTGCCGIHVHVTRAALTEMQLSKLLVFYHEPTNSEFLSRVAGRTVGRDAIYCKTAKKKVGIYAKDSCGDHHGAITISRRNHGKTAEVRIFRGNATYHGIMRCIEFVDATVQWCGQNASSDILDYKTFLTWFNTPSIKSQYPELRKYLIQLGYLKPRIKNAKFKHLEVVSPELQTA